MPHVVTGTCINCRHTYCAEICPAECFHEGVNFLVIDPDECMDCMFCASACILGSIMEERDVPPAQREFIALNAELARVWPKIAERKDAPPDTEEWETVPNKLRFLER